MSEVIFLRTPQARPTFVRTDRVASGPRIFVRETQKGWLVHDEQDKKGGCFARRHSAFRFVKDQFGEDAEVIVQPLFDRSARISHFRQSASVAERAIVAR